MDYKSDYDDFFTRDFQIELTLWLVSRWMAREYTTTTSSTCTYSQRPRLLPTYSPPLQLTPIYSQPLLSFIVWSGLTYTFTNTSQPVLRE